MIAPLLAILLLHGELGPVAMDVLYLHREPCFQEENVFLVRPKLELVQIVSYNSPAIIDEEYELQLFIEADHPDSLTENKTFHLPEDTNAVRCFFDFQSAWNWEVENASVEGTITVRKRSRRKIALEFHLSVWNSRQYRVYRYEGTKTFSRSNKKRPHYWNDY